MTIELDQKEYFSTAIKIIGVGGAGGNAVNTMIKRGIEGVEFVVANTDVKDLKKSLCKNKIQIGEKLTKGHGGGANPIVGKEAALESEEQIRDYLKNTDMLFISAGLGGGTGTGAAPVIADIARSMGILTLAIVTKPLVWENNHRMQNYEMGLSSLTKSVDSFIVIPNDKMTEIDDGSSIFEVFQKADSVIYDASKAISNIINKSGFINVDFADVKTVMTNMGYALMGTGICEGDNRAERAAIEAISNPLLNNVKIKGCKTLLMNITVGEDAPYAEFTTITKIISEETGVKTNSIIGLVQDEEMNGKICVTIFAGGIGEGNVPEAVRPPINNQNQDGTPSISAVLRADPNNQTCFTGNSPATPIKNHSKEVSREPMFMRKFRD